MSGSGDTAAVAVADRQIYPWGNQGDSMRANVGGIGGLGTTPVGSYPFDVSSYGCYDMAGIVNEWTSTTYQPYPYQATDGREDLNNRKHKVRRGDSWINNRRGVRTPCRAYNRPEFKRNTIDVRLVCGAVAS